jgi:hypothetical protein
VNRGARGICEVDWQISGSWDQFNVNDPPKQSLSGGQGEEDKKWKTDLARVIGSRGIRGSSDAVI